MKGGVLSGVAFTVGAVLGSVALAACSDCFSWARSSQSRDVIAVLPEWAVIYINGENMLEARYD
jgi:hypothetical protein